MRTFILALMALILLPMETGATIKYQNKDGVDIYYSIYGSSAYVAKSPTGYSGHLSIPTYMTYQATGAYGYVYDESCRVVGFCEDAFEGSTGLTSLDIDMKYWQSVEIPHGLLKDCVNLKEINITNSELLYSPSGSAAIVRVIDDKLLAGCKNTIIPSSTSYIGNGAFEGCKGLEEITIPNNVKYIESWTFKDCPDLKSIIIYGHPDYTSFDRSTFEGCTNLTSVTVKNGGIYAGGAFAGCSEALFEEGVEFIAGFGSCTKLTSIIIPNSVKKIEDLAFSGCTSLESVTIGGDNIEIGFYAFQNCIAITDVIIGEGKKIIIHEPFWGCMNIRNLTVHGPINSGKTDSSPLFGRVPENIYISDVNVWCNSNIGLGEWNQRYHLFLNGEEVEHLKIPEGVTTINDWAFSNCISLKSVTIPSSMTSIGWGSFYNCDNLLLVMSAMENPCEFGGVGRYGIDQYNTNNPDDANGTIIAQEKEYSLMKKHLLTAYVPIGTISTYENTSGWEKFAPNILSGIIEALDPEKLYPGPSHTYYVTFTANSYAIESGDELPMFGYTSKGDSYKGEPEITCEATKDSAPGTYPIIISMGSVTGVLARFVNGTLTIIEKSEGQGNDDPDSPIVISDAKVKAICLANWDSNGDGQLSKAEAAAVTSLGTAFQGNTEISSFNELQYFTGLTKIANDAFYGCTGLNSVTLSNSVTEIGEEAFYNCTGLKAINWGTGIKKIGDFAFCNDYDSELESVTIPDGVEEIGWLAFLSSALTTVTLPTSIKKLSHHAFSCAQARTITVNISDLTAFHNIEVLPNNYGDGFCFDPYRLYLNGTEVTSVSIPNNATSVGLIYSGCASLKSVAFHKDVTEIAENAFSVCPNITKVIAYRETPTNISGTMRFDDEVLQNANLYVPHNKTTTYYNAGWRFTKIYEINSGDTNGNDVIDPNDIELVRDFIMTGEEPEGFRWQNANANGDNEINAADIVIIVNIRKASAQ